MDTRAVMIMSLAIKIRLDITLRLIMGRAIRISLAKAIRNTSMDTSTWTTGLDTRSLSTALDTSMWTIDLDTSTPTTSMDTSTPTTSMDMRAMVLRMNLAMKISFTMITRVAMGI